MLLFWFLLIRLFDNIEQLKNNVQIMFLEALDYRTLFYPAALGSIGPQRLQAQEDQE